MCIQTPLEELQFRVYGKHAKDSGTGVDEYLRPAMAGRDLGLLSEAGCPAIADPGAAIVRRAHEKGIQVMPFVGTSSLILDLMASGFNGQQFAFPGKSEESRVGKECIHTCSFQGPRYHKKIK